MIPCVPCLDSDGPLPFGAYRTYGRTELEPARTCLLTVALNFRSRRGSTTMMSKSVGKNASSRRRPMSPLDAEGFEVDEAVRCMQKLIDSGFTSFQVADGDPVEALYPSDDGGIGRYPLQEFTEEEVYHSLRRETPSSVLRSCHFPTKVVVPPKDSIIPFGNGSLVREEVGASLRRTGADCIDTVQVPYRQDSPYHLDVLNVLSEMQREGIVRSVSGICLPPSILKEAEECGFHLDTSQVSCNLLDPGTYAESSALHSGINTTTLCGSPLAGGLLTDKYLESTHPPPTAQLSSTERRAMIKLLPKWASRNADGRDGSKSGGGGNWERFHSKVLRTLGAISRKHQVSVAIVALRWSIRLDGVGSVAVGTRLGFGEEGGAPPFNKHKELRELFKFDLDEEDMARLWEATGWEINGMGDDFVPDFSNEKLWL
mgnify:CR=1 FL=1